MPTVKGYRFFVDQWRRRSPAPTLDPADRRQVNDFFSISHGGFESILSDTTGLLSDLTDWTAVVVAPSPAAATVRSAQLVELSAGTVMVVAVMSNGVIEKRTLDVPADTSPEVVADASERLAPGWWAGPWPTSTTATSPMTGCWRRPSRAAGGPRPPRGVRGRNQQAGRGLRRGGAAQ